MIRFRIYYGDGSAYSGDPYYAPAVNVQVVVNEAYNPQGYTVSTSKDAYYWTEIKGWNACDIPGMYDYLMLHRGPKAILFGRTIRDEDWQAIVARAHEEGLG